MLRKPLPVALRQAQALRQDHEVSIGFLSCPSTYAKASADTSARTARRLIESEIITLWQRPQGMFKQIHLGFPLSFTNGFSDWYDFIIEWTNSRKLFPFHAMSSSDKNKASFGHPIINLILTGLAFLFFTWILRPHVPVQTELMKWIFSAVGATALTLTFYLSLNMYRVTVNDHKKKTNL